MPSATLAAVTIEPLAYVFMVLKHCDLPQPDYKAIATEAGLTNANNAQKRFKAIVEKAGYNLVDRQIVDTGDKPKSKTSTDGAEKTPPKRGQATTRKKKQVNGGDEKRSAKKRKLNGHGDSGNTSGSTADGDEEDEVKMEIIASVDDADAGGEEAEVED